MANFKNKMSVSTAGLRELREKRGMSQLALAVEMEVSLNTVSLAERSERATPETAAKLARVLRVSIDDLAGED